MKRTYNNNFTVEILNLDSIGVSWLSCYSYGNLIIAERFENGNIDKEFDYSDMRYYSNTTRRHQGISNALRDYFIKHNGETENMSVMVSNSRSLRDLVRHFGYISYNK